MSSCKLGMLCAAAFYWFIAHGCFAREVLFYKVSRNYDSQGRLGEVYRQELETRMFMHSTWHQRVYYHPQEPDIDETIEVYSNTDGSNWLSCRRANPSITEIVFAHVWVGAQFDLAKKLDGVRITGRQIALPADAAKEMELLWHAMLSGLRKDPDPAARLIVPHAPSVIAFSRKNDSIKAGMIAMSAYNTPNYRAFMDILDDLIKTSNGGSLNDPILAQLPAKLRSLRSKLEKR